VPCGLVIITSVSEEYTPTLVEIYNVPPERWQTSKFHDVISLRITVFECYAVIIYQLNNSLHLKQAEKFCGENSNSIYVLWLSMQHVQPISTHYLIKIAECLYYNHEYLYCSLHFRNTLLGRRNHVLPNCKSAGLSVPSTPDSSTV
jgi:hypothetical protein